MKYIDIEVKQEDVTKGVQGTSDHCPVALALRRKYPMVGYIAVGYVTTSIGNKLYFQSRNLSENIKKYDKTGKFRLGTYRVFEDAPNG